MLLFSLHIRARLGANAGMAQQALGGGDFVYGEFVESTDADASATAVVILAAYFCDAARLHVPSGRGA